MEPWQRVWIDAETYFEDVHSYINCTDCHAGQSVADMETAHTGLIADPSADPETTCGACHTDIAPYAAESLHNTLAGYDTTLYERSSPEHFEQIEVMEANHCDSCHATCGDCHIAQPNSVGGGLLAAHSYVEPPMSRTCTGCHGSRVKDEYFGAHEGISPDVHFRAFMQCSDCHTADSLHGISTAGATHRYDGEQGPACESCHAEQVGVGSGILQHEIHGTESVSCQVCHSASYTNCVNCHVETTDEGVPFFSVEDHSLGFFIGRNELISAERPFEYVPVRHVPIARDSFSFYGIESEYGAALLPNFDARSTWAYATPHNIQRNTPQTASCLSCHENPDVFLTPDDVIEDELAANQGVIVFDVPALPEGYEDVTTSGAAPASSSGDDANATEDFFGGGSSDNNDSATEDFFGGGGNNTDDDDSATEDFFGGGSDSEETDDAASDPADFFSE